MSAFTIGIDLGGTNLRIAAFDAGGRMLKKITGRTPITAGPDAVLEDMAEGAASLRQRFGAGALAGVGAGVPGNIDLEQGVVVAWNNAPSFNGYPMRAELSRRVGCEVYLENDANAAALGEHWMGAGREVNDLVMLTLGTGVGGGILAGGRVLHGQAGMAGELGHITVSPNGNPCGCGNRGCLEQHASATAVAAMARMAGLGEGLSAKDVARLAAQGNERACAIYQSAGEALGIALAALVNIFNFPLYLLGGGMADAWDQFAPAMLAEVERRSLTYRSTLSTRPTRIARGALGGDAGLYGAAYLALHSNSAGNGATSTRP
jgi:glucokinase